MAFVTHNATNFSANSSLAIYVEANAKIISNNYATLKFKGKYLLDRMYDPWNPSKNCENDVDAEINVAALAN